MMGLCYTTFSIIYIPSIQFNVPLERVIQNKNIGNEHSLWSSCCVLKYVNSESTLT